MMSPVSDAPSLGTCCICGGRERVTTLLTLSVKGKVSGHGWGCVVCNLPSDGAVAVLCEICRPLYQSGEKKLLIACMGYPATEGRIPISELTTPHMHDARVNHDG